MCNKRDDLEKQILQCLNKLPKICPSVLVHSIRAKVQEFNSKLFNHLCQIKTQKLQQLIGPPATNDPSLENNNITVVTIPENLPLPPVLSKGLNFVPVAKRTDQFSAKQDVEKFLCFVQLKPFFHDKEDKL